MNLLYLITWPGLSSEIRPREFYERLLAGDAAAARFPFDCPYEVGLVRAQAAPGSSSAPNGPRFTGWAVAVLAVSAPQSAGSPGGALPQAMEDWFSKCQLSSGAASGRVVEICPAARLKLETELAPNAVVVSSFGTFVGAPAAPKVDIPTADLLAAALTTTATAAPAAPGAASAPATSAPAAAASAAAPATPVVSAAPVAPGADIASAARAASAAAGSFSLRRNQKTCLTWALVLPGILLALISLCFGSMMALGQFGSDDPTNAIEDFWLAMACIPLPVLLVAALLVLLGIFLPRWIKTAAS